MHPNVPHPSTKLRDHSSMLVTERPVAGDHARAAAPDRLEANVSRRVVMAAIVALLVVAIVPRLYFYEHKSAFLDEASYILTGRVLLEFRADYARALNWTYGSYLWPVLAGTADLAGGLRLVRGLAGLFGLVMVPATLAAAYHLAPPSLTQARRWTAALLAGLMMALAPSALGISHLGVYDAPAAAGLMSGVAFLAAGLRSGRGSRLLLAAVLVFCGFLAKYLVALFFPFLCLLLLMGAGSRRALVRNLLWFVLPLSLFAAGYMFVLRDELRQLLVHATTTSVSDLRSDQPWREYVSQRPEVWLLAALALAALPRATWRGRVLGIGGALLIAAFHALSRADYDWWKHSVYAVFFLAPLAALSMTRLAEAVAAGALALTGGRAATGTERVVAFAAVAAAVALQVRFWPLHQSPTTMLVAAALAPLAALALLPLVAAMTMPSGNKERTNAERGAPSAEQPRSAVQNPPTERVAADSSALRTPHSALGASSPLFAVLLLALLLPLPLLWAQDRSSLALRDYPDLTPALAAIREQTHDARHILSDDSAVRYYVYRQQPDPNIAERVRDPFYLDYRGRQGLEAYRAAISDRYFDTIVLDGGIGPVGRQLRAELMPEVTRNYEKVFGSGRGNAAVEVFRARDGSDPRVASEPAPDARVYRFTDSAGPWMARPKSGDVRTGMQLEPSLERRWENEASLRFAVTPDASLLSMQQPGAVSTVIAHLWLVPRDPATEEAAVAVYAFDQGWQWSDNGFPRLLTGRWVEVRWDLSAATTPRELGLAFDPRDIETVYIGRIELRGG